ARHRGAGVRADRARVGERSRPDRVGDREGRRVARRGGGARKRGDVGARRGDRDGGLRRGSAVSRHIPRYSGVLERDDSVHGRLRTDGLAGDRYQRRPGPRPARPCDVSRSVSQAVPRRRRRHAITMKRPLVVKFGSSLVIDERGRPRRSLLRTRAGEIAAIVESGTPSCIVSSGAIALGLRRLDLTSRPTSLPRLQAASALGQSALQRAWQDALGPHGLDAAQILLTSAEIAERRAYVNVRNALGALFSLGSVPVVNENDATATDEISFGDNDALAAQVAVLVRARLLVLLTSVPGVLREGVLIEDGAAARSVELGPGSALGRGGMESKIAAAELAAGAGIPTLIADGRADGILTGALAGRARGTRFAAAEAAPAFKLWLRHGKRVA